MESQTKKLVLIVIIAVVLGGVGLTYIKTLRTAPASQPTPTPTTWVSVSDKVRVTRPLLGEIIKSPLEITGEARGTWYFEASFPVKLLDGNGKEIAAVPAMALSDWMTADFVPFRATIQFTRPDTAVGTLILQKDNPSGLPQNEDQVVVPVRFR